VPADELEEFNRHIVGLIEVTQRLGKHEWTSVKARLGKGETFFRPSGTEVPLVHVPTVETVGYFLPSLPGLSSSWRRP
jgi:hypothetical protein